MPNLLQPVLANLEAIIQAIVLVVILASGAVRMFRESKEVQRRAERQRPQRRPAPNPAGQKGPELAEARAGAPERQAPQETIRSEVEEFLRRVGEDKETEKKNPQTERRQPPQRAERQPRIEILDEASGFDLDERPKQTRRKPRSERTKQPKRQPKREPVKAATLVGSIDQGDSVADYVAEHLKRGEFEERASHLGEEVAQTDERLEARLHQKFDHRLGSLSARRQAREAADLKKQKPKNSTVADGLFDILSTPQGVQQAVILNEVLSRPSERW